jgi:hypothetical protein
MNVEIGTQAAQFLVLEHLFQIFGIVSLHCSTSVTTLITQQSGHKFDQTQCHKFDQTQRKGHKPDQTQHSGHKFDQTWHCVSQV